MLGAVGCAGAKAVLCMEGAAFGTCGGPVGIWGLAWGRSASNEARGPSPLLFDFGARSMLSVADLSGGASGPGPLPDRPVIDDRSSRLA